MNERTRVITGTGTLYTARLDGEWIEVGETFGPHIEFASEARQYEPVTGPFSRTISTTATFPLLLPRRLPLWRSIHVLHGGDPRRAPAKCSWCNPVGNPAKLAVNGAEYARRRRHRKARR